MDTAAANRIASHTMEDIYNLPDGVRAELMDGKIYLMSVPDRMHQHLVMSLSYVIKDYIVQKDGGCEVYPSPFAVFLQADKELYELEEKR